MKELFIRRVMAMDLRSRRFSYVVFEGPHTLLDWGTRTYSLGDRSLIEERLSGLQSMFAPSTILVRKPAELHRIRQTMIRPSFHVLKIFARRVLITVRLIDDSALRGFFSSDAKVNKYDMARMVAERLPELSWRLPPKRKPWQTEPTRQSIFDAASLGVFYFAQEAKEELTATPVSG
jgi:hypothetical protein